MTELLKIQFQGFIPLLQNSYPGFSGKEHTEFLLRAHQGNSSPPRSIRCSSYWDPRWDQLGSDASSYPDSAQQTSARGPMYY